VPVKVEQMNAYLFSDTSKIDKNIKWKEDESIARSVSTGDIRPSGRGGRAKEEKTSKRDEL
jgi:hypothetical protein